MSMTFQAPLIDGDAERSAVSRILKVGLAFMGGACLAFLSVMAFSPSAPEPASLLSMPTSAHTVKIPGLPSIRNLPGNGPWKDLALASMQAVGQCQEHPNLNGVHRVMATMRSSDSEALTKTNEEVQKTAFDILKGVGATQPTGFWDPFGYSTQVSEGRLLFFREAEIKHGRVCMLATLGIFVGENFHPLFGGQNWDGPATQLFPFVKDVPLNDFWPLACIQTFGLINWLEVERSYPTLDGTAFGGLWFMNNTSDEAFVAKSGRVPGDLGWDPLGLKPKDEASFVGLQNREINNGRLAMLAAIGMIGQEVVTGKKIFPIGR